MANATLKCPRCRPQCSVCQNPATHFLSGPPANPKADERYGGVATVRCQDHLTLDYSLYEVPPLVQVTPLTPCGAEMKVSIYERDGEGFLDEDLPAQCPQGHVFTLHEVTLLEAQAGVQIVAYQETRWERMVERAEMVG